MDINAMKGASMQLFKKGKQAVRLFSCAGIDTASIVKVKSVSKKEVRCEGDDHLKYDPATGREIDPVMMSAGIWSRLVPLEE